MKLFYNWRKFTENDIEALFDIYKDEEINTYLPSLVYSKIIEGSRNVFFMTNIPLLFLFPVHVVLLELIIDPTCSIVLGLGIVLYTPLSSFLKLAPLSFYEMIVVIIISIVSVMWYDCKIIILPI